MQSQDSEIIVRRAVPSDQWEIYKRTLLRVDASLIYNVFVLTMVVRLFTGQVSPLTQHAANFSWVVFGSPMALAFLSALCLMILVGVGTVFKRYRLTQVCRWSSTWIVETNGRLVAVACIRQEEDYATVSYLRVDSSYRRRGIGTQLVRTLVEQTSGALYLKLRTDSSVSEFYRRLGFRYASFQEVPLQLKPFLFLSVLLVRP